MGKVGYETRTLGALGGWSRTCAENFGRRSFPFLEMMRRCLVPFRGLGSKALRVPGIGEEFVLFLVLIIPLCMKIVILS